MRDYHVGFGEQLELASKALLGAATSTLLSFLNFEKRGYSGANRGHLTYPGPRTKGQVRKHDDRESIRNYLDLKKNQH